MPRGDGTGRWHQGNAPMGFGGRGRGMCVGGRAFAGCRRTPETVALLEGRILYLEEELKELRARRDALGETAVSR